MNRNWPAWCVAISCGMSACAAFAQPGLIGVGGSRAWGVSADSTTIVGESSGPPYRPYRWSAATGLVVLSTGNSSGDAYRCSSDGSVVVGQWSGKPFRWTQTMGLVTLPPPPPAVSGPGIAYDVSGDGSVVVGSHGNASNERPFVWTEATGTQVLPTPGFSGGWIQAISGDGRVIAGFGTSTTLGFTRGYRWTAETGAVLIPLFPNAPLCVIIPSALNSDGSVMVGFWEDAPAGVHRGFVWRFGQVPVSLLPPSGYNTSEAFDVSEDGTLAVGVVSINFSSARACVWKNGQPFLLTHFLAARGVVIPTNTTLFAATGVSANGRVIVGYGEVPGYSGGSFRAEVPCYADCDGSTSTPATNVNDFICFLNKFAAGDSYANCDGSTTPPVLNVSDFVCFQNSFAAGCT
ncbi:MAG: GC-type dockerin domain-anchored protein [Phycisphaerales bacterium]